MMRNWISNGPRRVVFAWMLAAALPAAPAADRMELVPKWNRCERAFKSSVAYAHPVQDVSLKVTFTSPLGETAEVDAFWDGGKTWRVRFAPDQPGPWRFRTACSDPTNPGLHDQAGEFLCTAATGATPWHRHGPVRVARDRRHFEHTDGTPFFWLADTVWDGARLAESRDWDYYASTRARQSFTVVQWAAAPGEDARAQSAWGSSPERITINPAFFQRLDAKITALAQAGLVSAIVPLWEQPWPTNAVPLPDDQAECLVRYMVARWSAEPVVWLLAIKSDAATHGLERWKRIGQTVFGDRPHAPVVLFPGRTHWLFDEFRDQEWVDAFGYQNVTDVTDDALMWAVSGPFTAEWQRAPARPLIVFAPHESSIAPRSARRFTADDVRRAAYWGLLLAPPAGVSYGAEELIPWAGIDGKPKRGGGTLWREALTLSGAKQMSHLATFMNSLNYEALRPQTHRVAAQPGRRSPQRFIAAASTEANTLTVVYVPEDRSVQLRPDALPASPAASWFNPRTGSRQAAVARGGRFTTPAPGDWLLLIQARR